MEGKRLEYGEIMEFKAVWPFLIHFGIPL